MQTLIENLNVQHQQLRDLAGRVDEAVRLAEPATIRAAIHELREALTAHLELEDRGLYPELLRLAREAGREALVRVADDYESSMRSIGWALHRFLLRYGEPSVDMACLEADWKNTASILLARLVSEELFLFPLYSQLVAWKTEGAGARRAQG